MKERPILFQGAMVRALLAGTKTQTRRIVKAPVIDRDVGCELAGSELAGSQRDTYRHSPYGQPGDRLWVRETWGISRQYDDMNERERIICYRAGEPWHVADTGTDVLKVTRSGELMRPNHFVPQPDKWKPSIFMRPWMSRLTLEVVSVRVERLRDINEFDAEDEGVEKCGDEWRNYLIGRKVRKGKAWTNGPSFLKSAKASYATLWDSINAKPKPVLGEDGKVSHYISFPWAGNPLGGTREHRGKPWYFYPNPWVWVVEFKSI